jgi:hypothetical protein
MNTRDLTETLTTLFGELVDGAPTAGAYMLNRGDAGLLASLEKLTAADASRAANGGAAIAAHVDHLRYGLSLMNRWQAGQNPFDGADWSASWRIGSVSDAEWKALRSGLRSEARGWLQALGVPRDVKAIELNGVIGSIAHLAYHMGAIRQIAAAARGPAEPQLTNR